MESREWLVQRFEENRSRLRAVAYRMLGSMNEADDAVQESWLRLSRTDARQIENLGAWLTTVVARVCLDMLRSRKSRREDADEAIEERPSSPFATNAAIRRDPEQELAMADSVGLALLVMLDRLAPAERVAFVLHDVFGVGFEEIAGILDRAPAAARQLASRARKRVQGATVQRAELSEQRTVVNAFLEALRAGDMAGLLAVLDPDVAVRIDAAAARPGGPREIRGAENWARGAVAFSQLAKSLQLMLVDGSVGLVWAPNGQLRRVLRLRVAHGKIVEGEVIADPRRLRGLDLAVLDG